jgi:hypothetical protein
MGYGRSFHHLDYWLGEIRSGRSFLRNSIARNDGGVPFAGRIGIREEHHPTVEIVRSTIARSSGVTSGSIPNHAFHAGRP